MSLFTKLPLGEGGDDQSRPGKTGPHTEGLAIDSKKGGDQVHEGGRGARRARNESVQCARHEQAVLSMKEGAQDIWVSWVHVGAGGRQGGAHRLPLSKSSQN